jgi:alkanesulfonate monooxygenase SsuD/methylene tetrahydromethanopterin reductase-like flavin-dependent oxidoreductase (luciferase family)
MGQMKFYTFDETTYPGIPDYVGPETRLTNRFCNPELAAQTHHPFPIWMPAGSAETIEFAAERRIPIARVWSPTAVFQDAFEYYKEVA